MFGKLLKNYIIYIRGVRNLSLRVQFTPNVLLKLEKIKSLKIKQDQPFNQENQDYYLYIHRQLGGCAGMKFTFALFSKDKLKDNAVVLLEPTSSRAGVATDKESTEYLNNTVLDYCSLSSHSDPKALNLKSEFTIRRIDSRYTCGCGKSFNPRRWTNN
ncbi:uncharacterized protein CMU_001480 [Cryptosporidium muris RN66]|uniref:Iron-sulfur cluster assembly accessory protein n=1 Tax=Cryptosporidium muris (strain RN66) TaxID=441375 RepID=B6AGD6_CRYMR|nr:uncharacterized protein CMU_001480 [Cryptosporidium muris RN66]EEA07277.1 hypothetical protein CMU_001480 [Cryptosporidium muris RN66]|eukprot:XP_002141626.1 hypothetical protein [Cryptosporidium muris RN66]